MNKIQAELEATVIECICKTREAESALLPVMMSALAELITASAGILELRPTAFRQESG